MGTDGYGGHSVLTRTRIIIIPVLLMLVCTAGCRRTEPTVSPSRHKPFTICMGGILAPLPFIAQEKNLFQAEGVSAKLLQLGDGKEAMTAFLEGKCDACVSGEFPVVRQSFERKDLAIIATLSSSDNGVKILARKDRGIRTPADLSGRKLGVSHGTIANFFLDQFLKKNKISRETLTIVDISHREIADALNRGEIDAFPGTDVAYLKGKKLLGDEGITFAEPGITNHVACLTVKTAWLSANPGMARSVVKALVAAEAELSRHPEELASTLSRLLDVQQEELKNIMAEQHNRVRIDQGILLVMEDEARWMMENGIVKGTQIPNYLHVLKPSILKSLHPAAVTLR